MSASEKKRIRLFAVVFLTVIAALPVAAKAVSLHNRDRATYEVVVNHSDRRSEVVKIGPRQTIAKICADCVILTDTSSVEAKGDTAVKIERGNVSINRKR